MQETYGKIDVDGIKQWCYRLATPLCCLRDILRSLPDERGAGAVNSNAYAQGTGSPGPITS